MPDLPSKLRTGFTAPSEERCYALIQQGTQCRRRSTIHDTVKCEAEKSGLERAEDKMCEQHKKNGPGLAVRIPSDTVICSYPLMYAL